MRELVTKMRVAASPEEIFEAFVDPQRIGKFWFSTSSARWEAGSRVYVTFDEYGVGAFPLTIVEATSAQKIVFTWGEAESPRQVDITISETEAGASLVTVTESGWLENDALTDLLVGNKEGWVFALSCLKAYLENGVTTLRTGLVV